MVDEEALARAMCIASGDNPDAQVLILRDLPRTALGYPLLPNLNINAFPGWHFYRPHARAAIDELKKAEAGGRSSEAPVDRPR